MEDNLEKFFNKHMNEEVPKEEWNTPSDDIWDKTILELNKKKPRNRSVLFLWITNGILLLGLLYALIYISLMKDKTTNIETIYQEQIDNYTSKINESKSKSNPQYDKTNTRNLNNLNDIFINSKSKNQITNQSDFTKTSKNETEQLTKNRKTISDNAAKSNIKKLYTDDILKSDLNDVDIVKDLDKSLSNPKQIILINKSSQTKSKELLNTKYLPSLNLIPFSISKTRLNTSKLIKKVKVFNNSENHSNQNNIIGVFIGPTLTAAPMSGQIHDDFSTLVGSSDLLLSYEFGAQYNRRLFDNLFLKTGLTFRRIKFWSKVEISDTYNQATEFINDDGDVENIQNFAIPTALGLINTDLYMTHPLSMEIENGDQIDATVHLTQHLYYLSIPLGLEYYYPLNNRIKIKSGLGLSYNKIVGYKNLFDPLVSHNGNEMGYVDLKSSSMDVSNSLNYFFSLGITRAINNKFTLSIDSQYFKNIKTIYKTGEMQTKVHGFSLKIGSNYIF